MKCYKCQKELSVEDNQHGMSFHATVEDPYPLGFIKKQWGKYYEDAMKEGGIALCFECILNALLGDK